MLGICIGFDNRYTEIIRDMAYLLPNAFPGIVIYERGVPDDEPDTYCGHKIIRVQDADDLPTDSKLVIVSGQHVKYLKGKTNLVDYVHPENAIYYFGDDLTYMTQGVVGKRTDYDSVHIPIPYSLWSPQAISMVLYDRLAKNG